jgi:hypothetical protein
MHDCTRSHYEISALLRSKITRPFRPVSFERLQNIESYIQQKHRKLNGEKHAIIINRSDVSSGNPVQ